MADPFQLHLPRSTAVPIVASIPHSGLLIPGAIATTFQPQFQAYLPHQNWHFDKLYDFLPEFGITVLEAIFLAAIYSRCVVVITRSLQNFVDVLNPLLLQPHQNRSRNCPRDRPHSHSRYNRHNQPPQPRTLF
jgi:N-formylglutamate amidohydrolase